MERGHRQSAHDGHALRPRGADGGAGGGGRAACTSEDPLGEAPGSIPLILATGGFAASRDLLRAHVSPEADHAFLRAAPGSTGDGLRIGLEAGGRVSAGLDQVYARAMPAPPARIGEGDLVRLSQLYAKHATVTNERGERYETRTWSEIDVAQWQLRQPRARAWFTVPNERLGERVRERTVAEMVDAAEAAGAPVRRGDDDVTVETVAGVTTTLGGLAIDAARARDRRRVRLRRRRRRNRDRRLRERPGGGSGLRPDSGPRGAG